MRSGLKGRFERRFGFKNEQRRDPTPGRCRASRAKNDLRRCASTQLQSVMLASTLTSIQNEYRQVVPKDTRADLDESTHVNNVSGGAKSSANPVPVLRTSKSVAVVSRFRDLTVTLLPAGTPCLRTDIAWLTLLRISRRGRWNSSPPAVYVRVLRGIAAGGAFRTTRSGVRIDVPLQNGNVSTKDRRLLPLHYHCSAIGTRKQFDSASRSRTHKHRLLPYHDHVRQFPYYDDVRQSNRAMPWH